MDESNDPQRLARHTFRISPPGAIWRREPVQCTQPECEKANSFDASAIWLSEDLQDLKVMLELEESYDDACRSLRIA
jgi:hypothetical protein